MPADYLHNPPQLNYPIHKHYYVIVFLKNPDDNIKGKAVIYRRHNIDSLLDLLDDLDQLYFHSEFRDNDNLLLQSETVDQKVYIRVYYTNRFHQVIDMIDPNGYTIHCEWDDIPHTNYPGYPYPPHVRYRWPYFTPAPPPRHLPPHPPIPIPLDPNEIIQRFGDQI